MSNEPKWTKGSWVFVSYYFYSEGQEDTPKKQYGVTPEKERLEGVRFRDIWNEHDAHLIAAAPELAEVARKLIEDYEAWQRDGMSPHEIGDIVDEARDALSKARGETS